jgi:predicted outer membrane repeat protein
MHRARAGALLRTTGSVFGFWVLLAADPLSARGAVTVPAVTVPCGVSALAAALGNASAGETLTLATRCDYRLTAGLPTVSQDLTIDGNGATLERSYAPGTPAFTILTITGGSVTIDDLEIRNGDNGITLSGQAAVTVNHSIFVGNHGTDGGAISSNTGADGPVVNESLFIANQATDAGGAIYNNSALNGVAVTGSTFRGNVAVGDGGAIFDFSAIGEQLTGSLIEGNRASEGGGIWFSPNAGMSLSHDTFSGNAATGFGGGMAAVNFNSMQLQGSTFTRNRAVDGGGLYATIADQEIITDSEFMANTAQDGGAIYSSIIFAQNALTNTRLVSNRARINGGGIYDDSTEDPFGESWSATDSEIIGNFAGNTGGGAFNTENATGTVTGSRVRANFPNNCAPPGSVTGCTG